MDMYIDMNKPPQFISTMKLNFTYTLLETISKTCIVSPLEQDQQSQNRKIPIEILRARNMWAISRASTFFKDLA